MRIDKLLSHKGFGSRKDVKKLLKDGSVFVNGRMVNDGKIHVIPGVDEIVVKGLPIEYKPYVYFMMNKPAGVISATEDDYERTVLDLMDEEDRQKKLFPAGRLDKDTVGLLLLTNDGELAHRLLSPKKHVRKTYFAIVEGWVTDRDAELFREGIVLEDGYRCKPAELNVLKSAHRLSEVELTITEGKFHQVKRMFRAIGKRVVYLKRISMGPLRLDDGLAEGCYRELTDEELQLLEKEVGFWKGTKK
jgi:ribosomal small subunit pseudouridine synthase A (EC 5.4.99.-)